jgi:mannose-6-phosphate isomerase-like protein (cupin superfamily)
MEYIAGSELNKALQSDYRVYLCGNLCKPQNMKWIPDGELEIGISFYKEFTADKPHFHAANTEYNYVINGMTKLLLIDYGEEFIFEEGSLFIIPPHTKYASKHIGGTRIIFVKNPGGNDKKLVDINKALTEWLKSW